MPANLALLIAQLRSSLAKMESALGAIAEAIVWTDGQGRVQWCNAALDRLTGLTRIATLGKPLANVLPLLENGVPLPSAAHPATRVLESRKRVSGLYELAGDPPRILDIQGTHLHTDKNQDCAILILRVHTTQDIPEQLRLQNAALAAAGNAIVITDNQGDILWANSSFTELTGYTFSEAYGKNIKLLRSEKHGQPFYEKMYESIYAGRVWRGELINRRKDGSFYYEDQTITPVLSPNGDITHFIAIKQDATRRVMAEAQRQATEDRLQRANLLLEALRESHAGFKAAGDHHAFFDSVLNLLLDVAQSKYGFIGEVLHSPEGAPYLKTFTLTNIAWDEETRRFYEENAPQGLEFRNLKTLFGAVLTSGEPVISNDPDNDPRSGGRPAGHPELRAFLGLPVHFAGQFVGMIGLANKPGGYEQELIQFLRPALSTCGAFIRAIRDNREQQEAQQALAENEARLRAILDNAVDAIIVIDEGGVIESVNPACQQIFGYTQEEMLGQKVNMLMPSPHAERHDGYMKAYMETGVPRIIGIGRELEALRKNGTTFPMELTVSEVLQDGRRRFMSIIRDVTERQAAENALRRAFSDLENKQQRLDEDLKAAAKIQESLLPSEPPSDRRIRVSWVFHPSQRIGGDIFDVVRLDENRYAFILVDVSGHGVPSALVAVSVSQALDRERLLESQPDNSHRAEPIPPASLLHWLDQEFPLERFNKYFTMFYLVLDLRNGKAAYSAAAHPPPLLLRSGGGHEYLDRGGSIIGMGGIVPFEQGVVDLRPGDRLFMYTDGITEAEKHQGQMFGQERLQEELEALRDRPLKEVADRVHAAVMMHSDRPDPEDDVTLLCLEFLGQG